MESSQLLMRTVPLLACWVLLFNAGTVLGESIESRVVDASTGQPIAGVVVLATGPGQSQIETETDARGRFRIDMSPDVGSDAKSSFVVYRCGYILWTNTEIFDPRDGAGAFFRPRPDTRLPSSIALERFPREGNLARQVALLGFLLNADGMPQRRPKFARQVQCDTERAKKQCGPKCED